MSFGFSAGDIYDGVVLIKNVVQALDSSTGSAAEYSNLYQTLKLLESALEASILVYKQWEERAADSTFGLDVTDLIAELISEHQGCIALLKTFLKSMASYTDAFVDRTVPEMKRHVKKVLWLLQKDGVAKLDHELQRRLEALQLHTQALFYLQLTRNTSKFDDVLSSIAEMKSQMTAFGTVVQSVKLSAGVSSSLGPWGSDLDDSILLHDAIGGDILLPKMLLSTPAVLHELLKIMYRDIPGRRKILKREYTIEAVTDDNADGTVVVDTEWHAAIQSARQLLLNVKYQTSSNYDVSHCPRCSELASGQMLPGRRRRCIKCHLNFRVFDVERIIEESDEVEAAVISGKSELEDLLPDQECDNRSNEFPLEHRGENQDDDESFHFKHVHYHREVLIRRKMPQPQLSSKPDKDLYWNFEIEELPRLHRAAARGALSDIEKLIKRGKDINSRTPDRLYDEDRRVIIDGALPIHIACYFGKLQAVDCLLSHGAIINSVDRRGAGVIHYAILGPYQGQIVLPLLTSRGADANIRTKTGDLPIHFACLRGIAWLIHPLPEYGNSLNDKNRKEETPLSLAAAEGHEICVETLLDLKVDLKHRESEVGWDALHIASFQGHVSLVELLLRKGSDLAAKDRNGRTPLLLAAMKGEIKVVRLLLASNADPGITDVYGHSSVHLAACGGSEEVVTELLGCGLDINSRGRMLETPLHVATWHNDQALVKLLLAQGADIHAVEENKWHPLHMAARDGYESIVLILLEAGAPVEAVAADQYTPLQLAVMNEHEKVAMLLLQHGAQDAVYTNGSSTLHVACRLGYTDVVRKLLEAGADINSQAYCLSPLMIASSHGHRGILELLLRAGADVNSRDEEGSTALCKACYNGQVEIARELLNSGAQAHWDDSLYLALHLAAYSGSEATIRLLLQHGVDINSRNTMASHSLHWACLGDHLNIVKLLLEEDLNIDVEDDLGRTPLNWAIGAQSIDCARFLLDRGCRLCLQDNTGWTAWKFTEQPEKNSELIDLLAEYGCDLNEKDADGDTALHIAVLEDNFEAVQCLWKQGCSWEIRNKEEGTPLEYATDLMISKLTVLLQSITT